MLELWTRAAKNTGSHRFFACIPNGSAIASRSNVPRSGKPWPLGAPTSTFVYTTIFAAGLTVDAAAKRQRNKQWETAFEQLEDELKNTRKSTAELRNTLQYVIAADSQGPVPDDVDWDEINRVAGMDLEDDAVLQRRELKNLPEDVPEGLWDLLAYDSRFPGAPIMEWPANTGSPMIRHHLPPQSLWSPTYMRWTAIRKRQTWKKIAIQRLSISHLIHSLLQQFDVAGLPLDISSTLSPFVLDIASLSSKDNKTARFKLRECISLATKVEPDATPEHFNRILLQADELGIPQYYQDKDGDFYHICKQMNDRIKQLFLVTLEEPKIEEQISSAVAKICHTLFVSTSAPDVHTFNILIGGFKSWKRAKAVDSLVEALDRCKIRPNEITCAMVLEYYIEMQRPEAFTKFVASMRGADNALMLARPDITINEMGESRLVRINENKVYQKVYPTPMVFNVLMHGVLRFAGFDRALEIYYEMKEDHWGLDIKGLTLFLHDCIKRADWIGGTYIWKEITSINGRINPKHLSSAYSHMLSLCSVTGNTVAFNHMLRDVVRMGFEPNRVLKYAQRLTHATQRHVKTQAPAFTADNLLIAVGDYMSVGNNSPDADDELPTTDPFGRPLVPEGAESAGRDVVDMEQIPGPSGLPPVNEESGTAKQAGLSPDDAWALWMQHELGESVIEDSGPKAAGAQGDKPGDIKANGKRAI